MIGLFAGGLRFLGLSQAEAAEMLRVTEQSIKNWSSGRSSPPAGVWAELRAFALARERQIAALRPYTLADAAFVLSTLDAPPPGFPCADSYVTTLAAAMLTTSEGAG